MNPILEGLAPLTDAIEATESMEQLEALLLRISAQLLFPHHLLSVERAGGNERIIVSDLPADGGMSVGMLHAAAGRRVRAFFWNSLTNKPQNRAAGASMFVVPMHIPEIATGLMCWFLPEGSPSRQSLAAGQYLAGWIFEQAYRLSAGISRGSGKLSPRQRDCLRLAARGKSDWVASQILGLQPDTVHKYMEQAKARYNVSTRTELVVRALYDGEIHFSDLID